MSKKNTESPTVKQLKGSLNHLTNYEFWMLCSLANILAIDFKGTSIIHNALIESFLIHARILIEFLYRDKPYKDTAIASQYFKSDSFWKSIRPPKTELLKETEAGAHKHLVHLTYTRLEEKKQWPFIKIAKEIEEILRVFRENLPKNFARNEQ